MKTPTTEQRNAAFKAASKPEKRVMIAQDVLAQLAAKKFTPKYGCWAVLEFRKATDKTAEVCDVLDSAKCTACALGSMMISEVRINDALKLSELDYGVDTKSFHFSHGSDSSHPKGDRLEKYFTRTQLILIEIAFERGLGIYSTGDLEYSAISGRAVNFTRKMKTPRTRLRAIMENIVANNGTFLP